MKTNLKITIYGIEDLIRGKKRGCEGRDEENGKKKTLASNCELMLWFIKLRKGWVEVLIKKVN